MMNNKYKTTMCKHFETTGQCPIGARCNFAHGPSELRKITDPLPAHVGPTSFGGPSRPPQSFPSGTSPQPSSTGNFRTQRCKYFFEKGYCRNEQTCKFAHSDDELRAPSNNYSTPKPMPTPTTPSTHTPLATGVPTVESAVASKQLQYLSQELEKYHSSNPDVINKVHTANESIQGGNLQGGAELLYGIMSRQSKSKEDMDNYALFTYNMQSIGNDYYQQMLTTPTTQPSMGEGTSFPQTTGYKPSYGGGPRQSYGSEHYQPKEHGTSMGGHGGHGGHGTHGGHGGYYDGTPGYQAGGSHNYGGGYQGGPGRYNTYNGNY